MKNDAAYYESAYNPRLVVPQYADHFERWRKKSATARAGLSGYLDVPYGAHSMQKLDIFRARGQSRALLANGQEELLDLYEVTLLWDGQWRTVETDTADTDALVGMSLLYRYSVYVEAVEGGQVVIAALPGVSPSPAYA